MKTLKLIMLVLVVLTGRLSAQENAEEHVTIGSDSYVVKTSKMGLTSVKPYSDNPEKTSASSERLAELNNYKLADKYAVVKAFNAVFSPEKLKQLIPERAIITTFYIDVQTGKVNSLSYLLRRESLVSVSDIDKLNNAIKKYVRFVLDEREVRGFNEVSLTYIISTERISNGSFTINN